MFNGQQVTILMWCCVECRCKGFSGGWASGQPLWRRQGLSRAGLSRFQLTPTDPPQGTAEPLNQDGGTSGK